MKLDRPRVLLIGYGNPGRQDDGLGPALAEELEKRAIDGLDVEANYQLTVEDAHVAAEHDVAIFADAALGGAGPYVFRRVDPAARSAGCGSHTVQPEEVAGLAVELFHASTAFYTLAIRGYAFDAFGERLSDAARQNLADALAFIDRVIREGAFEAAALPPDPCAAVSPPGEASAASWN
jgi:hydrogenase maturation protease